MWNRRDFLRRFGFSASEGTSVNFPDVRIIDVYSRGDFSSFLVKSFESFCRTIKKRLLYVVNNFVIYYRKKLFGASPAANQAANAAVAQDGQANNGS